METEDIFTKFQQDPVGFKNEISSLLNASDTEGLGWRKLEQIMLFLIKIDKPKDCLALLEHFTSVHDLFSKLQTVEFPNFFTEKVEFPPFNVFYLTALIAFVKGTQSTSKHLFRMFSFYKDFYISLKETEKNEVFLNDASLGVKSKLSKDECIEVINDRIAHICDTLLINYSNANMKTMFLKFAESLLNDDYAEVLFDNEIVCTHFGRMCLMNGDYENAVNLFERVTTASLKIINQAFLDFFNENFEAACRGFNETKNPFIQVNYAAALVYTGRVVEARHVMYEAVKNEPKLKLFSVFIKNVYIIDELVGKDRAPLTKSFTNYPVSH